MELGLRGSVIIALRIPHMLHWDSGVSLSPSGSLICYFGTQGGVIITLRIPHLLHWDSGGCPYHPQDPSYATMATVTILCGVLLFIKIP